ncbi:MFS transporter [Paenarthrobacter sp. DKR-5]|uniref:MFS transporter n=1 Tax=Paenarthrobacter sp. DKR-5 TaxID=2835535 RepID=UPI001BDC6285|nr:MFS transporter [Paenarthrobacter sp. DKR-5]MBT1003522.1 MFS transporter [Paenarthrobacter sp. DKR-5]
MSELTVNEASVHQTKLSSRGRKAIIAGSIGNTVEWVDWSVYTTFSSVFAHHFFPAGNAIAALLGTLAIFAVGFIMRPVGAAVLGAYADRHGRKKGLVLTIGLMACASLVIGLIPTFDAIGVAAPLLLLLARMAQGFSAGGEFGSSSAFLIESAAPQRRAFAGSWQQVSVGAGILIASGLGTIITSTLSKNDIDAWGWRAAFIICALLGVVGLWLRSSVEETESFTKAKAATESAALQSIGQRRGIVASMFVDHPRATLRVFGVTIAGTLLYYMWASYMPTYAAVSTHIPLNQALFANFIAILIFLVLLPFAGLLSDKIGRKPTMTAFAGGFLIFAWPAFHFLNGSFVSLLIIEIIGIVLLLGYSANCAVIMAEQFPAALRATGIGLPYALAVAIFGGTAPYITTWLNASGLGGWVWLYCAIAAAIGVAVYLTMPETKGKKLD